VAGLYLHIPFCQAICSYCNFTRGLLDEAVKAQYVAALVSDLQRHAEAVSVETIYLGGGTPSLLTPAELGAILEASRASFDVAADAEITLEANPESVTARSLDGYRAAGANRLSFCAQSFRADELARLGRLHTPERPAEVVALARAAGFDNVSLDLMLWLPGQTVAHARESVDRLVAIGPEHASLYLLELYPNAPLKESMARLRSSGATARQAMSWQQSSDDEAADMYVEALERLERAGLEQYEISNVARPGYRSRHNVKYWQGGEWLGFGCGAHTTARGRRWRNVSATVDYCDRLEAGRPVTLDDRALDVGERVEEALFTGLRMTDGIDGRNFAARYGVDPWSRYGDALSPFVADGFVWRRAAAFGLTRKGMLVANEILATFV